MLNSRSFDRLLSVAVVVVSSMTVLATTSTVSVKPLTDMASGTSIVLLMPTSIFCCSFGVNPWSSAFTE